MSANRVLTLREWQNVVKDPFDLIVQASTTDSQDRWQPFPIGMQYNYVNFCHELELQKGTHDNLALLAISATNDRRRRPEGLNRMQIVETCLQLGFVNQTMSPKEYFTCLPSYKFVISPEGNGIDCHRHYEALLAGCIPIVEYHPGIVEKYKGCPVLYTRDYSELTPEYLEQTYANMLNETYDFSRLFLSHYSQETQEYIKYCGNYWMIRCTQSPFYN